MKQEVVHGNYSIGEWNINWDWTKNQPQMVYMLGEAARTNPALQNSVVHDVNGLFEQNELRGYTYT